MELRSRRRLREAQEELLQARPPHQGPCRASATSIVRTGGDQRRHPSRADALATVIAVATASASDRRSALSAPAGTMPPNKAAPIDTAETKPPTNIPAIEPSPQLRSTPLVSPETALILARANPGPTGLFRLRSSIFSGTSPPGLKQVPASQKSPRRRRRGLFLMVSGASLPQAALRPARRSKNRAWLIAAFTASGWKGLVIRKAGSGRSPVSRRSG